MRPVNLIPPEDRRGDRAPLRTGALPYAVVAALALGLAAVSSVVLTGNTVSERETELASLEAREAQAQTRAQALSPYAEFASLEQTRHDTVASLAQSRFDWERVLQELALVIPEDVWLVNMTGTVSPEVSFEGGAEVPIRDTVLGPALAIVGCGADQDSVARFVAALQDVDGVTRVSVQESKRPELGQTGSSAASSFSDDCRTKDFIARFEIVAAFDSVTTPATTTPTAPVPTAPGAPVAPTDGSGVAETQAGEQQARDSIAEQSGEAREAVNLIPGVGR